MKKTIKYKKVGDFQIITGVGKMTIDPHASGANSLPKIAELEIAKTLKKKEQEKAGHFQKMKTAESIAANFLKQGNNTFEKKKNSEQLKKIADEMKNENNSKKYGVEIMNYCNDIDKFKKAYNKHNQEYKNQSAAVEVKNGEMRELLPEFDKQQKQVRRDNFVYDMPGLNQLIDRGTLVSMQCSECGALFYMPVLDEFLCSGCGYDHSLLVSPVIVPESKTVEKIISIWMAQQARKATKTSGEYVADFRGITFWKKLSGTWSSRTITELNVSPDEDEREKELLTEAEQDEIDEKLESERISELAPDKLELEKQIKNNEALVASVIKKSELEIQGDNAALKKSQDFYKSEIVKINNAYGV